MDTKFVFPMPQAPLARPGRPEPAVQPQPGEAKSRDSNALRASVLDAALELGIGRNSTMTKWMFSNAVAEEEEEEPQTSPGLTSGSTATSESSHASADLIYSTPRAAPNPATFNGAYNTFAASPFIVSGNPTSSPPNIEASLWSSSTTTTTFAQPAPPTVDPPQPGKRNKLKKKHGDGNESDGGYISDSARKRKDKDRKKKELSEEAAIEKARKEREKEDKKRLKEEMKVAERARKKSTTAREAPNLAELKQSGYDADGAQPSKKGKKKPTRKASGGDGYETDDGYMSSSGKKKKSFFKRKKEEVPEEPMPSHPSLDIPALPPMPLPIAERFATTPLDLTPVSSLNGGTAPPPASVQIPSEASFGVSTGPTSAPSSTLVDSDDAESLSSHSHSTHSHSTHSHSTHSHGHGLTQAHNQEPDLYPSQYPVSAPPIGQSISYPFGRPDGPPRPPPLTLQMPDNNFQRARAPSPQFDYNDRPRLSPPSGGRSSPFPPSSGRPSPQPRMLTPESKHGSQLTIVPSMDFVVPSPRQQSSNLPSPNRPNIHINLPSPNRPNMNDNLPSPSRPHVHDMPPPSPPPTSPLPQLPSRVPQSAGPFSAGGLTPSPLTRQMSLDVHDGAHQRGRTSPFPTRPVQPQPTAATGNDRSSNLNGFEARVKVPRYRELYALPSPSGVSGWGSQAQKGENAGVRWKHESDQHSLGIDVEVPSDDEVEADVDELRYALMGRFEQPASDEDDHSAYSGESALDRSHSFNLRKAARRMGAMDPRAQQNQGQSQVSRGPSPILSKDPSPTAVQNRVRFADPMDGPTPRPSAEREHDFAAARDPRWSEYTTASVYSRSSFVDEEKSDEMRGRLLNQIGAMYDTNGRERQGQAFQPPPMPQRGRIDKF
ncbi:hypothetical protein DL96DRAFT_151161 [Flagelloscypha sp. PMI_526]|nr:hypothetical protein DL96DRAFT_151161 [Flagelloscypha sp. PMI_526]